MDIRKVKATRDIYRVKAGKWRIFIKINFEKDSSLRSKIRLARKSL